MDEPVGRLALADAERPEDISRTLKEIIAGEAAFLINREEANPFQFHG